MVKGASSFPAFYLSQTLCQISLEKSQSGETAEFFSCSWLARTIPCL